MAPQVIQFFYPPCEIPTRSAFVLWALRVAQRPRDGKGRNFRIKILRDGTKQGAKRLSPRIAGERQHRCQSTAAFRRESIGRLKAADKTTSCRNERSLW